MLHARLRTVVALVAALTAIEASAYLRRGDVVVAQSGGLVRLDPDTGVMLQIPVEPPLREPTGVVVLPDGDLVVADWGWPRMDAGSVLRVHIRDAFRVSLASGPPLVNPFSLVRGPDGRIVVGDIDAGTRVPLFDTVLRKGTLFDLEPSTGALVRRVEDCCDWNPVALVFASPTRLLVADAGCCAYAGPGQLASADVATGQWAVLPTSTSWSDPFGLALSSDARRLYVAESAIAQPGLSAVRAVDLAGGIATTLVEGPPLLAPTGLLLEDDGRLLVADGGAGAVMRIATASGEVTTVAAGEPLTRPATVTRVDVGDVVSGVRPASTAAAACAARAAQDADRFVGAVLRCRARGVGAPPARCLASARRRSAARARRGAGCTACADRNRVKIDAVLAPALLRTPGRLLACAGNQYGARVYLARAAARLYQDRSRCAAGYLEAGGDPSGLRGCQDESTAAFLARAADRCDETSLDLVAAEVASLADALIGVWYCAP